MSKQKARKPVVTLKDLLVYECIEETKEIARREKEAKTCRAKQRESRLKGR